jgi:hypothetical protein
MGNRRVEMREPKRTRIPNGYILTSENGETLKVIGAYHNDITFGHEDPEIGHLNITRMKKAIEDGTLPYEKMVGHYNLDSAGQMLANRDIDPKVVRYLLGNPEKATVPVIQVGIVPDLTLVDGTHRMFVHWLLKLPVIRMHVIHPRDAKGFQIRMWLDGKEVVYSRLLIEATYQFGSPIKRR